MSNTEIETIERFIADLSRFTIHLYEVTKEIPPKVEEIKRYFPGKWEGELSYLLKANFEFEGKVEADDESANWETVRYAIHTLKSEMQKSLRALSNPK